jgi:hypothetical protein
MMRIAFLLGSALLAACAMMPVVLNKPEATPETVATDLDECRHLAADEAWRLGWETRWPPTFYNPAFMPPYYRGRRAFWLDFPMSLERERALVDFCMHSKGYHLESLPY